MSQYYSIKVGSIHDEDYQAWLTLCLRLHDAGLLDDNAVAMEFSNEVDGGLFYCIFEAVRNGDPNPERYIPKRG